MTHFAVVTSSAVLGLLVGSFLNVVIARVPAGGSVVHPPSHCPKCNTELTARDNIPIVSWLVLRARCRTCQAPISVRYPLVEAGTVALFGLVAGSIGPHADLVAHLVVAVGFVALGVIDLDTLRLPNTILWPTFAVAAVGFAVAAATDDRFDDMGRATIGAAIGYILFGVVHEVRPDGMGFGDVKLAALCGMVLGWHGLADVALGLYGSFVLGALVSVPLLLAGRAGRRTAIPFGPFLVVATLAQALYGEPLADWLRGMS